MNADIEAALLAVIRDEAGVADWSIEPGGKHPKLVFDHGGRTHKIAFSRSPSDRRGALNAASDLRKTLGLTKPAQVKNSANKERQRNKTEPQPEFTLTEKPDWREDLEPLAEKTKALITAPGVYDIPEDDYHADPIRTAGMGLSLSHGGAKRMLNTCPAKFRFELEMPPEPTKALSVGSAAHQWILEGEGWPGRHFILPDGFNGAATKKWADAIAERDAAIEDGKRAISFKEFETIKAMREALLAHPFASACFERGKAEQSLFWQDKEFGIWRRSRLDFLPDGRQFFADYKTCASAHPDDLRKSIWNYGYFTQAAWYIDGIKAVGLCDTSSFLFVFQEKDPPYLVNVVSLSEIDEEWGRIVNRKAIGLFAQCLRDDHWPGYADDVMQIALPGWAERDLQNRHDAGDFETVYRTNAPLQAAE